MGQADADSFCLALSIMLLVLAVGGNCNAAAPWRYASTGSGAFADTTPSLRSSRQKSSGISALRAA